MTLYVRQQKRDTDVKNSFLDSVGEGEGGMLWENSTETCILPYVKQIPVQVQGMKQGTQSQRTGTTLRDGMGREVGGVQEGGLMYTHGWFMSMYGKNHNIVISLQFK